MVTGKNKFALWLTPEGKTLVEDHYRADNCRSQSEYIEKAICFYSGYLDAQKAEQYLPRVLAQMLDAKLDLLGNRIGRLLFKAAVEQNMANHILAADTDIDDATLERLRGRSVREVRETNGQISFKDDLHFQRSV